MTTPPLRASLGLAFLSTAVALAGGCASSDGSDASAAAAPGMTGDGQHAHADGHADPAADGLGLTVGERVPAGLELRDAQGRTVPLASLHADRPVVLTFYRGGWCPYCVRALDEWNGRLGEIRSLGADFVAITPEKPSKAAETASGGGWGYRVLSDADGSVATGLEVGFDLDAGTIERYRGFDIDLPEVNGTGAWSLPHPGTFVIDTDGVVRYAHVDEDYAAGRANPDEVIAALRALDRG